MRRKSQSLMAVTRLAFQLTDGAVNYIDIASAMSTIQRTLIRQKQVFTVVGGMIVDNPGTPQLITVSTAPNTWYMKAAINRCFRAWKRQRAMTLETTVPGSRNPQAKYADFKILLNGASATGYIEPIATGSSGGRIPIPSNEWQYSTVKDEVNPARTFHIIGDHSATRYGAMKGWVQTRPLPNSVAEEDYVDLDGVNGADYDEDFLNLLDNTVDGQDERMDAVMEENDDAPFVPGSVYGGIGQDTALQLQCSTYVSSTNPTQMIPGFKALCGLISIDVPAGTTSPFLFLDVLNTPEAF